VAPIWRPGELLPDWYEDWVAIERERLRALRAHGLEALCRRLTAAGRFGEATEAGLAAVRDEPLRESAHRVLIGVHLAEGNRAAALQQYRAFARLLREEVGMSPSSCMEQLMESMTAG
jgi:DNA-binding SARP family transcriptional activator